MNKIALGFASALALAVAASPAQAASVIDQNAPTNNVGMAGFNQPDLAQSFQQAAGNISGAGIFLLDRGGSGTITISLWSALPNVAGATRLATGSVAATQNSWADVSWSAVAITANQTYYLVFGSSNTGMGISGDLNNGYARGQVYANSGYQSFTNFDYTFRTFRDPSFAVAGVPEPATWATMLLGVGMIGAGMRTRRRRTAVAFG